MIRRGVAYARGPLSVPKRLDRGWGKIWVCPAHREVTPSLEPCTRRCVRYPSIPHVLVDLHQRLNDDAKLLEAHRIAGLLRERLKAKCNERAWVAFEQLEDALRVVEVLVLDLVVEFLLVPDVPGDLNQNGTSEEFWGGFRGRLLDAPLAVATSGHVLVGARLLANEREEPGRLLGLALLSRRQVFVGVATTLEELPSLLR